MKFIPTNIVIYNTINERCDTIDGLCICGSWHPADYLEREIEKMEIEQMSIVSGLNVIPPIKVESNENYPVIIVDADDTYFFFLEKDGALFYDGHDSVCHTCGDDENGSV